MKKLLLLCAALWASPALADDDHSEPKGEDIKLVDKPGGKFSLLGTECKAEDDSGPETTPGAPPLDIDDPNTPGCNGWELNIVTSGDLGKDMSFEIWTSAWSLVTNWSMILTSKSGVSPVRDPVRFPCTSPGMPTIAAKSL